MARREKKFFRKCPNSKNNELCKIDIGYTTEKEMKKGAKNNAECSSCKSLGRVVPEWSKEAMSKKMTDLYSDPTKTSGYGKKMPEHVKAALLQANTKVKTLQDIMMEYWSLEDNPFQIFVRTCPNPHDNDGCEQVLEYDHKGRRDRAERLGSLCNSCCRVRKELTYSQEDLSRKCPNPENNPKCAGILTYTSIRLKRHAEKKGWVCWSCANLGKEVSEETRRKQSIARTGQKRTEEQKQRMRGRKRTEESLEKMRKTREETGFYEKLSQKMSGQGNPMYGRRGKDAPSFGRPPVNVERSGSGISGTFNDIRFSSTCELRFLMDNPDVKWIRADNKEFMIDYVDCNGEEGHYFPDFFGDNQLVEVKTIDWQRIPERRDNVPEKRIAAERFCQENGWEHRFVEVKYITKKQVFRFRREGKITLTEKWEKQYQEWENS